MEAEKSFNRDQWFTLAIFKGWGFVNLNPCSVDLQFLVREGDPCFHPKGLIGDEFIRGQRHSEALMFCYNDPASYKNYMVNINGNRYNYIDVGQPNPTVVVILHGFPESWFMFKHQIKLLVEMGYRVVAPDMIGYGLSDSPEDLEAYTYTSITEDIKELLDHIGVSSAIFMAHDWGSMFMWHLAVTHPRLVAGLISICIPIYEPVEGPTTLEQLAGKVPQVRYQLTISNSDPTELDANIRGFLETFLLTDENYWNGMCTTLAEKVQHYSTLALDRTLAVESKDMDFLVEQFSHSGSRGPTNYYRTYSLNRSTDLATRGKINIHQPTLYIKAEKDFVAKLAPGANHKFLHDLTEKAIVAATGSY